MVLVDEELNEVNGGAEQTQYTYKICPKCGKLQKCEVINATTVKCTVCGREF